MQRMSALNRITIKQLLIVGILGLVALAVAPAIRMLSGLSGIEASNRAVQTGAVPLSKTVASLHSALQELDNTQLRYLGEAEGKADRTAEITAGFRRLQILVAKMRHGSSSSEYAAERAKLAGALPDDAVVLPSGLLKEQDKALQELATKIGEAERGFVALKTAHESELALLVTIGAEQRPISSVAADILIEFRAWVGQLEQAAEYAVKFEGNTNVDASILGRVIAAYKPADAETDRSLKATERLQRRIFALAQAINRAEAGNKLAIFQGQGRLDFKRFETAISQLIGHSTNVVNASRAEVQSSLQKFQSIGADVFRLKGEIEEAATRATEQAQAEAQLSMEATTSVTWISIGIIAVLAPLFGIVTGMLILGPLGRIAQATESVAGGKEDVLVVGGERRDEIGRMARALVVFQQNIAETQRLRAEQIERDRLNAETKAEDMARLAAGFEASVLSIVENVATSSASMRERAVAFAEVARTTSEQATNVATTANETSVNVRAVAVATEELSASVRNIAEQTGEARRLSEDANRYAEHSVSIMASLDGTVRQIGDVVGVINQIAAQTNLLALNATIEAARAGEAGRGFAVVANEVKALAAQTAKATDDISSKIQSVQSAAGDAVRAIQQIGNAIPRITAASSVVAQAMNEQEKATHEIAGNVEQAALGVEDVTRVITDVADVAKGNGEAATEMLRAADGVMSQSQKLRQEVEGFLSGIRAA
jgi:methyl-accepting chemotaxis protein